jgi:hypothetical protein
MTKTKDLRKTYTHQKVVTSNNDVLYFDGKFDPTTKVMKVYRLFGDVRAHEDAYEAIGFDYKCDKVLG